MATEQDVVPQEKQNTERLYTRREVESLLDVPLWLCCHFMAASWILAAFVAFAMARGLPVQPVFVCVFVAALGLSFGGTELCLRSCRRQLRKRD